MVLLFLKANPRHPLKTTALVVFFAKLAFKISQQTVRNIHNESGFNIALIAGWLLQPCFHLINALVGVRAFCFVCARSMRLGLRVSARDAFT